MNIDNELLFYYDSINKIKRWVTDNEYYGWDIYDGLNSTITNHLSSNAMKILMIQINKYSPINIRPILKIDKGIDLKGMALFAQAYAALYATFKEASFLKELKYSIKIIENQSLKNKLGFECWSSHYYPYASINEDISTPLEPDIIGTTQAINALIDCYKITNKNKEKNMAIDAITTLIDKFYRDSKLPHFCYYINEDTSNITINATAQAIESISKIFDIDNNKKLNEIIINTSKMIVKTQKPDGTWDYTISKNGDKIRSQLDFHHGYNIDGLLAASKINHNNNILHSIIRASSFYYNKLFRKCGSSYYRYPLPYPIDIHNQAQGIITFSKLKDIDNMYPLFAKTIAMWTINNMQTREGYFSYQKWPCIMNNIPHMRWGQAWMILSLGILANGIKEK